MKFSQSIRGQFVLCDILYFGVHRECFVVVLFVEEGESGKVIVSFVNKQEEYKKIGENREFWWTSKRYITKIFGRFLENAP